MLNTQFKRVHFKRAVFHSAIYKPDEQSTATGAIGHAPYTQRHSRRVTIRESFEAGYAEVMKQFFCLVGSISMKDSNSCSTAISRPENLKMAPDEAIFCWHADCYPGVIHTAVNHSCL
jgi:hypothetical protein